MPWDPVFHPGKYSLEPVFLIRLGWLWCYWVGMSKFPLDLSVLRMISTPVACLCMTSAPFLQQQTASLLLYQEILSAPPGLAFLELLQTICDADRLNITGEINCLQAYGRWFRLMAQQNQSWQTYLASKILQANNPFTQQAQQVEFSQLPPSLIAAVRHDLQILQILYQCSTSQLSQWVQAVAQTETPPVSWQLPESIPTFPLNSYGCWADGAEALANYYQKHGTGLFAEYRAFRWHRGELVGIAHPDPIRLANLAGYETQKELLLKNTEFLLQGYPALHVLLYGSRGSGKSSLVKALLQEYHDRNLRLVEVARADLGDLPAIVDQLRTSPQKFIVFVDDLSFEEDEDTFKALKVVLEGGVTARPPNVVVYATSNRRHLVREFFADRPRPSDADEVHAWDTLQEKLSFSDRFGLTLTFEPANQKTYLQIIHHLAAQAGIALSPEELERRALQWATQHNGRSGRTARQFVDFLRAELALQSE